MVLDRHTGLDMVGHALQPQHSGGGDRRIAASLRQPGLQAPGQDSRAGGGEQKSS